MGYKLNPITGRLDITGISRSTADSRYVNVTGDVMTGTLDMQKNAIILQASDNTRWNLTIDTTGALITTQITTPTPGTPIGMLLALTYN
jgi:hypothetical protein